MSISWRNRQRWAKNLVIVGYLSRNQLMTGCKRRMRYVLRQGGIILTFAQGKSERIEEVVGPVEDDMELGDMIRIIRGCSSPKPSATPFKNA